MKALCINSSSSIAEVCVLVNDKLEQEFVQSPHSEKLMIAVDKLLTKNDLEVKDLDTFCVVVGPGSFTGVRIAVATIKGMAVVNTNAKIVSLTNFDLVAKNVTSSNDYLVVLDSGNEDRYVALYSKDKCVRMFPMNDAEIEKYATENNLKVYANILEKEKLNNAMFEYVAISTDTLSLLCIQKVDNKEVVNLNDLAPLYIKKSQAERARAEKIQNELVIEKTNSVDDLLAIENACFPLTHWSKEIFEEELSLNCKFYYMAKYMGQNIAYIGYEKIGDAMNIQKVATLEDYRNCGVASKLVQFVLDNFSSDENVDKILLEVNVNNIPAIKLYEKMGFAKLCKRDNYYKNGDACFVMIKNKK